jgi:hypothetical protein
MAKRSSRIPMPWLRPQRFKLYYHGGRFSGCYRCIGIPYASQQRSKKDRPRLQAARLKLFLGEFPDSTNTPKKPPIDAQKDLRASHQPIAEARSQ